MKGEILNNRNAFLTVTEAEVQYHGLAVLASDKGHLSVPKRLEYLPSHVGGSTPAPSQRTKTAEVVY